MFVVGVTGGIGSGKTTATDYFAALGIDVVDADIASRVVVEPGKPALAAIADHFGASILQADGALDRAALRQRIFQDPKEKQWLEALLHPLIQQHISEQLQAAKSPYAILVSPLLIEGGQSKGCDRVLVIDAPETLQLRRTVARDNNDPDQVQRIIDAQASRQARLDQADDVVENAGTVADLQRQIDDLHRRYLALAEAKAISEQVGTDGAVRVNCPTCQAPVVWSTDNPHRPFCSERCRNKDFVAWANEDNTIAGNSTYDDYLSEDLLKGGGREDR